jgi:hypothetical protein
MRIVQIAEAKFLTLDDRSVESLKPVIRQILDFKKKYEDTPGGLHSYVYTMTLFYSPYGVKVGEVDVPDRKNPTQRKNIPVFIGIDPGGFGGHYSWEENYILIDARAVTSSSATQISNIIAHEVGHASGYYHRSSKKFKTYLEKMVQAHETGTEGPDNSIHYTEPAELDALAAELTQHISDYYHALPDENKPRFTKDMLDYLRQGGEVPPVLNTLKNVISIWKRSPKIWNRIRSKLWNYVTNLQSQESRSGIFHEPESDYEPYHPKSF